MVSTLLKCLALAGLATAAEYTHAVKLSALAKAGFRGETSIGSIHSSLPATIQHETPTYGKKWGSQKVKIRYGPFTTPNMNINGGMGDFYGASIQNPCEDCTILTAAAGLENPDGSSADLSQGMWLHHVLLIDTANPDTVCGPNFWGQGNRWYASGNERDPIDYTLGGHIPTGYYFKPGMSNIMVLELMNQAMKNQTTYLTMTYEYVKGQPKGFYNMQTAWLDISTCDGFSSVQAKPGDISTYTLTPPWKTQISGSILAMGGHVHDGGVNLLITDNKKVACNASAEYGPPSGLPGMKMSHIDKITGCAAPKAGMMAKGEQWTVEAFYNFKEHPAMPGPEGREIMGIAMMFIAEGLNATEATKLMNARV